MPDDEKEVRIMEIANVVREPNIRRTVSYLKGAERATEPGERQTRDGDEVG